MEGSGRGLLLRWCVCVSRVVIVPRAALAARTVQCFVWAAQGVTRASVGACLWRRGVVWGRPATCWWTTRSALDSQHPLATQYPPCHCVVLPQSGFRSAWSANHIEAGPAFLRTIPYLCMGIVCMCRRECQGGGYRSIAFMRSWCIGNLSLSGCGCSRVLVLKLRCLICWSRPTHGGVGGEGLQFALGHLPWVPGKEEEGAGKYNLSV